MFKANYESPPPTINQTMMINLKEAFQEVEKYFSPKIIGEVNDVYIKLAKIKGEEVPWHAHEHEDELFYIVEGSLLMQIEGETPFTMHQGDMHIVSQGLQHRVSSQNECLVMLIENKTTAHTGKVQAAITKSVEEQQY
ncbi:cupin domain protein [Microscilla marina ATCC 23134]|uniref:Cupin domain protein n=2 Tax=Microscilla marina TaxID=1027 RepID=A1ZNI6_MICM2|nr:cupin domain protein [Microscilla marina ATCC 23134]